VIHLSPMMFIKWIWMAIMKICDWFFGISVTGYNIHNTPAIHAIHKKQPINLPAGVTEITMHGTYWFQPFEPCFTFLSTLDNTLYYPQGWFGFGQDSAWTCKVTFGITGVHKLELVEVSAEIKTLINYYQRVGDETNHWVGINLSERLAGIRKLGAFTINVA
jgi:hypothetical protein